MPWRPKRADASFPSASFGASTGAAAALVAAAERPEPVRAIVSRSGRPGLKGDALPRVQAPTLLILGSLDEAVIDMIRRAARRMRCERELSIVPGAFRTFFQQISDPCRSVTKKIFTEGILTLHVPARKPGLCAPGYPGGA